MTSQSLAWPCHLYFYYDQFRAWENHSFIRYLKLEDSISYLMIFYLSSGQEWSDRGEEVSTIAMTGKQRGKTRKETTAALAGEYEIATLLIDLHEHGWLHLMFHFWLRTLWTRSPHDMTERCHQARKSIDLSLPKEMESGINFSFYL